MPRVQYIAVSLMLCTYFFCWWSWASGPDTVHGMASWILSNTNR